MSETLQLNPPIPVWVCRDGQWRKALAHFRIDYGIEHHTMWGTFDDKTGEPWDAPNPCVRIRENWSAGRHRVSLPGNVVSDLWSRVSCSGRLRNLTDCLGRNC